MDEENKELVYEDLKKDLIILLDKYKLGDASFCATEIRNGQYVGMVSIKYNTGADFFASLSNVGRLWQHCREQMKKFLDGFERNW